MADPSVHRARIVRLQQSLETHHLDLFVTLHAADIAYLTGFFFAQTERPAAIAVSREGEAVLLLPHLDIDQAAEECWVDDVRTYAEFPGTTPPIAWMGVQAAELAPNGRVGLATGQLSVRDHATFVEAAAGATVVEASAFVGAMRQVKEPDELAAIRAAAHYADRCQVIGAELLRERRADTEYQLLVGIQARVQDEIVRERTEIVGARALVSGAVVSGTKTAFPHGFTSQRPLVEGEAVMLSFGCTIDGYRAENTRTYWVGELPERARALDAAVADAQAAARRMVGPGVGCADIDLATTRRLHGAGYGGLIRHRVGHGIGLEGHEPPWVEAGDATVLAPNMMISIEPGLYEAGFAGFLIADTVLVTGDGHVSLTTSPRAAAETAIRW